jgi:hypothetical protein
MPSCVICGLEPQKRAEIERDLANGRSLRSIAAECNCDKESVRRHLQNHVAEKIARIKNEVAEREGIAVINALVEQYEVVQEWLKRATEGGKVAEVALMLKEGRKHIELGARLTGQTQEGPQFSVLMLDPLFVEFKQSILAAVRNHPEVKGEISAALRRIDLRPEPLDQEDESP